MTRYPAAQAQRARHLLNREALKRSHRRGELIRILPDLEADSAAPYSEDAAEAIKHPTTALRS